jgi:hypothetical protein
MQEKGQSHESLAHGPENDTRLRLAEPQKINTCLPPGSRKRRAKSLGHESHVPGIDVHKGTTLTFEGCSTVTFKVTM